MYKIVVKELIFCHNVKVTFFQRSGNFTDGYTRFRFKFVAKLVCWLFNNEKYSLKTYHVVKID